MKNALKRVFNASATAGAMTGLVISAVIICEVALAGGMKSAELLVVIFGLFWIANIVLSWREATSEEDEESESMDREIMLKESVVQAALLLWICEKTSPDLVHYEKVLEAESRRLATYMDKKYETTYQSEKEERDEREPVPEDDEMPKM